MMQLYPHQIAELEATEGLNHVAYYHDMGLGKTFTGAEKLVALGSSKNLIICQKSKVGDWVDHFRNNYVLDVFDLTKPAEMDEFLTFAPIAMVPKVGIINYDLVFRRTELTKLEDFTLMLDESSLIQNENSKRSKFILKLHPKNVILLSGTPTGGKYENLWSQMHLLGWDISKDAYWKTYVDVEYQDNGQGFPIKVVRGYKNVERLKRKMSEYGCRFLKTDEVFDLPEQVFQTVKVPVTDEYRKFRKNRIVHVEGEELVGDTILKKMLYERMLCGAYNPAKLSALGDLLESTEDRVLIFYNFTEEHRKIENLCLDLGKPVSTINGFEKDLSCYEQYPNSVTLIQYQAGAMGLNLQKAHRMVFFSPTLQSELFEQSKKRIHRIGQKSSCFYYMLSCGIEDRIYEILNERRDYTDYLFALDIAGE